LKPTKIKNRYKLVNVSEEWQTEHIIGYTDEGDPIICVDTHKFNLCYRIIKGQSGRCINLRTITSGWYTLEHSR